MNHFFSHRRQSVDLNAVETSIRRASMVNSFSEQEEEEPTVVLGYHDSNALVSSIRLLLQYVYAGQKIELRNLDLEEEKQANEKESQHLETFSTPNSDYLTDGDMKITEDTAIIRYLARKHGLVAHAEEDVQLQDTFECVLIRLRSGNTVEGSGIVEPGIPILHRFNRWLTGRELLVANELNYTDFILFELLDATYQHLLPQFSNLEKFYARMLLDTLPLKGGASRAKI